MVIVAQVRLNPVVAMENVTYTPHATAPPQDAMTIIVTNVQKSKESESSFPRFGWEKSLSNKEKNKKKFRLPKKRPWELISGSEKVQLLVVDDNGTDYKVVSPWRWVCCVCGNMENGVFKNPRETPDPQPPNYCAICSKQSKFKPLFTKELTMLWDEKWRVPWALPKKPEPCDFNELYEDVKNCLKKHLVLQEEKMYDALACWILADWKAEDVPSCAYLLFRGEHESGKTRGLEILTRLGYRAIPTVGVSPALLFRQIEAFGCTCLIDQAEDELNRKYEAGAAKYAIVASGYKQGMFVGRVDKQNPNKVKYFETYAFKGLASTKSFDVAIDSRCIIIDMEEADPENEDIDEVWCTKLRSKLLYWRLMDVPFEVPQTTLRRRTRELFLPLLWIAELRGTKETVEAFGVEHYRKKRKQLPDEFRAAMIDIIRNMALTALNVEGDDVGRIYLTEIKEQFQAKGWEKASVQRIGRELSNMDIERYGPVRGKGRYVDVGDSKTDRKLSYYTEKFGLKQEEERA